MVNLYSTQINAVNEKHVVSTSKHCFYKMFGDPVCKNCSALTQSDDKWAKCDYCGQKHDLDKFTREGNFFIELPLEAQLRNMIQNDEIPAHIIATEFKLQRVQFVTFMMKI